MLPEGIYRGKMRHRRYSPTTHDFTYPLAMTLLDIDKISDTVSRSRWWSEERFNIVSLYQKDRLAIREYLQKTLPESETATILPGKIQVLTQPRFMGYGFNPVSFYLCFDTSNELRFIVAEIHNTPWNERFQYCLDTHSNEIPCASGRSTYRFSFDKAFHVSPFMPLHLRYDWRFSFNTQHIAIHMQLHDNDKLCFDATLSSDYQAFNATTMRRMPIQYALQSFNVVKRIYWHALLLWLKKVPFYEHPKHSTPNAQRRS